MTPPLSSIVRRHKNLIGLLVVLVLLLISIACFPLFMSLTVPPDRLMVCEITEQKASEGMIIHLDDQNIREYPLLEEVLPGSFEQGDGLGYVGGAEYPKEMTQAIIDRYIIDNTTGMRKYFEYEGRYYSTVNVHQD